MIEADVQVDTDRARAFVNSVQGALSRGEHFRVVETEAAKSFRRVVEATPKGWTGKTRQEWKMNQEQPGEWRIFNDYKVMRFLEHGTQAHGPKTAKALYIPLTRSAAIGGWRPGLVFGLDYVLAKRVRGIRAMNIVRDEEERAQNELGVAMRRFLTEVLNRE